MYANESIPLILRIVHCTLVVFVQKQKLIISSTFGPRLVGTLKEGTKLDKQLLNGIISIRYGKKPQLTLKSIQTKLKKRTIP